MHTVILKLGSYIERHLNISVDEGWLVIDKLTSDLIGGKTNWRKVRNGVFWTDENGDRCSATIHMQDETTKGFYN